MSTPVRVLGFLAALVAVFAVAVGVGTAVGPLDLPAPAGHGGVAHADEAAHGGHDATSADLPGGLAVSEGGYTLRLARVTATSGAGQRVAFHVEGPDGAAVTAYDVDHGKRLHLIAVRRDLTGYQHVHPVLADDGTWSTRLELTPGTWRLIADFNPTGGVGTILGADLSVDGTYRAAAGRPDVRTVMVDGYEVTLGGDLEAGAVSALTFTVTLDGEPVTDLQPYLGAYGHLVALREGDLAYLHVHPEDPSDEGGPTAGPDLSFLAEVPNESRYRLFLDFRHDGTVHTAELPVTAVPIHEDHS